jgi:hypothetical protein
MLRHSLGRALLLGLVIAVASPAVADPPNDPPAAAKKHKKPKKGTKAKKGKKAKPSKKGSGAKRRKQRIEKQAARLDQRAARLRKDGKEAEATRLEQRANRLRANADEKGARRGKRLSPEADRRRRKYQRLKGLRKRYGKDLDKPLVQHELSLHAERSARLNRMKQLAEENDKTELLERILKMSEREDQRHEQQMQKLLGKEAPAPSATTGEATP